MADTNARNESDVKQSFAWGQLFAGSLIGGLAVWKLLHKLTNTEPSEWFRGVALAYDEVREFLMTPLQWMDLTADEKNAVTICIVLIGASVRAGGKYFSLLGFAALLALAFGIRSRIWLYPQPSIRPWLQTLTLALLVYGLVVPAIEGLTSSRKRAPDEYVPYNEVVAPNARLMVGSVFFTVGWGVALLLLSWATS